MTSAPALSALASPRRCEILRRLVREGELSAGAIHQAMPDVTFGAVSLQLRKLLEAGLVESRAEGRHRFYRGHDTGIAPFRQMLERMWDDRLWALKLAAEFEESRRGPRPAAAKKKRPKQ